jgi:iron complex outermembrane receptor protein
VSIGIFIGLLSASQGGACYAAQLQRAPEVVVSATRFEDHVDRHAVNSSVITRDEIARSSATTLPEIIGMRAGVQLRDLYGNDAALSSLDLRGFGATAAENTLILVNGRAINDIDQSGVQWASIPLAAIERVEIMRGSGAVQYGAGASAGVINIITRHPQRDGSVFSASTRFGSHGTVDLNWSGNVVGGSMALNAVARNFQSDGYRVNNEHRQTNIAFTGTWTGTGADAALRVSADRQGIRLPGPRLVQPSAGIDLLASNRRGTQTPLDYAQRDGNHLTLDFAWQTALGDFALGLGYREKVQRSYFDFGGFPDYRDIALDMLTAQPRYRLRGNALGMEHTLVAGIDIARWDYRLLRSDSVVNVARPFNTVRASQDNDSIYVLDTVKVTASTTINAGVRRERQRIAGSDFHDAGAPGGAFGSGAPAAAGADTMRAYELGLRQRLAPALAFIVRGGQSFRFANVDEIYEFSPAFAREFQLLRPQRARSYETGVAYDTQTVKVRGALFQMDVKDEIHLDPFSVGVGNRNLPKSRRNGVELEVSRSFGAAVDLFGAYTFTNARFLEGNFAGISTAGKDVPLVSRHKVNIALGARLAEHTRLRMDARYGSRQRMENDDGNTFAQFIPSYTVADIKLTQRVGKFSASLGVANAFDRKYYAYAVHSTFVNDRFNAYPLPERTAWIALSYESM